MRAFSVIITFNVLKFKENRSIIFLNIIKTVVNEQKEAGYHSIKWNRTNNFGIKVSSGVYIYRMKINTGYVQVKKMVFLK